MTAPEPHSPGVSAPLAVVFATVAWFAFAIMGLGMLSFFTDRDIIAVSGVGPLPGAVALGAGGVAFAATLASALRRTPPSFGAVVLIAVATPLAHLVAGWVASAASTADPLAATVVAGDFVRGGVSAVLLLAAFVAGWGGIALRRTRTTSPRWPWERADDDER